MVGILRGVEHGFFSEVMSASFEQGLQAIEVTMNTSGAEKIVADQRPSVPTGKFLGMGTIRNLKEAERAIEVGAMFLVSPNSDTRVIRYAKDQNVPIVSGALTPTEVYNSWFAGADMVKVFPCCAMGGAKYIRDLLGPYDTFPLMAVGGVTIHNLDDYFEAGAAAVGVGSSLFGSKALKGKDIKSVAENVKRFISCCPVSEKSL